MLKSYDDAPSFRSCPIWQVARATSAATTFFKPIRIGRDEIEFIDAGFGYNNPCELLIAEAERIFPADRELKILSIGTGIGDVVAIKDRRLSIIKALKKMASSSRKVEAALYDRYGDSGNYYRFVVNEGLGNVALSDWELTSQISAHTRNYLRTEEKKIKLYVGDVRTNRSSVGAIKSEPGERAALDKAADHPDSTNIAQNIVRLDGIDRPWIKQGGSMFRSAIKGKDIKQGNRLEISHLALYRSLVQQGSNFEGEVSAEQKVEQGNHIKL